MNQSNNIIGYDPQTGQPIYANQNTNINWSMPTKSPKNNNKVFIIIAILIVFVVITVLYFYNQDKKKSTSNETPNNSKVENNNNKNDEQQNNNSTDDSKDETNTSDENNSFLFSIEDVFTITDRGTVVTGHVQRGKLKVGDTVQIIGLDKETITAKATGMEMFREKKDEANVGDNVAILLENITREQVQKGQVLAKPNSIKAVKKFDADVYILTNEEGGRHTPFFESYRPQFCFKEANITGEIELPEGVEMVMPGDNIKLTVKLVHNVAMEKGTKFNIKEGDRIVGKGTVTKIY